MVINNMHFLVTIILVFMVSFCAKERVPNFSSDRLEGVSLDGRQVRLADIRADRLALNVYSPTCVPCVKEIPTLNFLYKEFMTRGRISFYLVVDPYLVVENSEGKDEALVIAAARKIMQDEVIKRNINLPVLIMKKPFAVGEKQLVSGTPETLLFHTEPLVLYYNFIGSISEETVPEKIARDTKVGFFKKMLGY